MFANWRERLRRLREQVIGGRTESRLSKQTTTRQSPLAINLGIDFGTSFTKVCFRDIGTEESGIVTFGGSSLNSTLIPSIVRIDSSGILSLGSSIGLPTSGVVVRYLKMRLADLTLYDRVHGINDIDLDSKEAVRALSSWYLGTVISRARIWVLKNEADRAKGREVQWSANVGVPIEYYDSPAINVFREVLAVAWIWATEDDIPRRLDEAVSKYEATASEVATKTVDCHAIPEIAAAVQSFISSREAQPGVYVYFDIGGGTVDGVGFEYINRDGQRRINFYSGKIESLGVAVIADQVDPKHADIEEALVNNLLSHEHRQKLAAWAKHLQRQVAYVILTAKTKDNRGWQRSVFPSVVRPRKSMATLDISQMVHLIIFVGGGGASSHWYQRAILSTYEDFGHLNVGIPPYELIELQKPTDFDMYSLEEDDYRRFSIAYGLSIPKGEGPDISLPSEFEKVERRKVLRMRHIIPYEDTRDAYDK